MHLVYTHGLGGSLHAQPEIEEVFAPLGYEITRIPVSHHNNVVELFAKLITLTFGDLCRWIDDTAGTLIAAAQPFAPEEYVVVGDSFGGLVSAVAAERDPRISHCIMLSCSGDVCGSVMRLHKLGPGFRFAGRFIRTGKGGLRKQAEKAVEGKSDFQNEFELIDTLRPERLAHLRRLLILGDKGDPIAPEAVCLRFGAAVPDGTVRMVYNERRHHPVGKDALERYAVPFLRNQPVPTVYPPYAVHKAPIVRILSSLREALGLYTRTPR
jgi:pimeloyl-ACP methyl ester carboxylesterase